MIPLLTECNPGTYGENCKESCGYCKDRQACDITNGTCPTGCQAGYGGDICKTGEFFFSLTITKRQNFRQVQTESICRRQFKCGSNE